MNVAKVSNKNYTVDSVDIPSKWIEVMSDDAYNIFKALYKFKIELQDVENTFLATVGLLSEESQQYEIVDGETVYKEPYTIEYVLELLLELEKLNIINVKNVKNMKCLKNKELYHMRLLHIEAPVHFAEKEFTHVTLIKQEEV